ncbi:hypothetical protein PQX77_003473 [Marasmius sp. AFHP31]|nr:hypothetical protein PQX77_003473 [Marasmius sp. AFHP31]
MVINQFHRTLDKAERVVVLGLVSIIIEAVGMRDTRNLDNYRLYEHGDDIERVYNGAHAAANLLITILTASRIWRSSREARGSLDSGVRRLYQRVVAIILESGVLYPILTFVNIALIESASEIGTPIYLFPTVTLIAGIAPTLMIVRCKVFNALQDHSVREAGALTTVQFNVNTGTDSTFDQYGSQVRGLETQVRSEEPVMKGESNGDGSNHDEEKGAHAASRTSPPSGAIVVRPGTTTSGEFKTIQSAVNSLPNDSSSRSIFLYPGTYTEQVYITRSGPLTIYGYTSDTSSYTGNQANIAFGLGADQAGSNDASGTLRIHKDNFKMYNVNVRNTRGKGIQAIALSQYGNRAGFYGCGFYGYQDTMLVNQGTQVYLKGYIEGRTDFIFGLYGQVYFGGNTIAVSGPGYITASGRDSNDVGSYVFNANTIIQAPNAESGTSGGYVFGRPWRPYAKVIFKNTVVNVAPKAGLFGLWNGNASSVSNTLQHQWSCSRRNHPGELR